VPYSPLNAQRYISEDKTVEFLNIVGSGLEGNNVPDMRFNMGLYIPAVYSKKNRNAPILQPDIIFFTHCRL
jgi:hypothetical protein